MSTHYTACRLEVLSFDDNMCRPWVHTTQPAGWKCHHLMTKCVDHQYTLHSLQAGSAIIWWPKKKVQTMSTFYTACRLEVLSFDDKMCRPSVHTTQPAGWKCHHLMTKCVDHQYTLHSLQAGSAIIWWPKKKCRPSVHTTQPAGWKCYHLMTKCVDHQYTLHSLQAGSAIIWWPKKKCRPWVHSTQPAGWKCYHLMTKCVDHQYTLHSLQAGSAIIW